MKKTAAVTIAVCMMLLLLPQGAFAYGAENMRCAENGEEQADISAWEEYFEKLGPEIKDALPYSSVEEMILEISENGLDGDAKSLMEMMSGFIAPNLVFALKRLVCAFTVAIMMGIVSTAFDKKNANGKTLLLFLSAMAVLSVTAVFSDIVSVGAKTVDDMARFSEISAPVFALALVASGCVSASEILSPKLVFLSEGLSVLINGIVMPVLVIAGVLTVINAISDIRLERTIKLIHKTVKWLLGIFAVIFSAVTVLGGLSAGAVDSVASRTAKYALDKLFPSGGGIVSGAFDTIGSGAALVKNSIGLTAIVLIVFLAVQPLITIACGMYAFRLASAASEMFSDESMPKLFDGIAETLSYVFVSASSAAALFILNVIMMIVAAGSASG